MVVDIVLALPPETMRTVHRGTVTLPCSIGAPKPLVRWYHGTDELTGNRFNIASDGSLIIKNVKYIDDGEYFCMATNRFGHVNAKWKLIVMEQTRITQGPRPCEVEVGDTATFRFEIIQNILIQNIL